MRLKVFRAASPVEAMARIRTELGPDALIVSTRRVAGGVEVTAALEPNPEPLPRQKDPQLLAALAYHGVPETLRAAFGAGDLPQALAEQLRFAALPLQQSARPLVFVGPPGAGKTLTVARLATRLVLEGRHPMVITTDDKRAGATEQLAAFTRLLGLTLVAASHPVTLGRALARRPRAAPVLIDAPGGNLFDITFREEIEAIISIADAEPVLVLPAGLDPSETADLALCHADAGASLLIATRIDIARRLGGIVSAAAAGRLALTEAGIGPGAADGLVPLTADFLAKRLYQSVNPVQRAEAVQTGAERIAAKTIGAQT